MPPEQLKLYTPAEAAAMLSMSKKTLAEHTRCGRIRCVIVGGGKQRKRRRYTDQNIQTFIKNQKVREVPACPSTSQLKPLTTATTSKSTVIAFSALQKSRPSAKLRT